MPPASPSHPACIPMAEQLFAAAARGDLGALTKGLATGGDPNASDSSGWTPLLCAAQCPSSSCIRALLAAGRNPNALTEGGCTAQHRAASFGRTTSVSALLAAGAVPRAAMTGNQVYSSPLGGVCGQHRRTEARCQQALSACRAGAVSARGTSTATGGYEDATTATIKVLTRCCTANGPHLEWNVPGRCRRG